LKVIIRGGVGTEGEFLRNAIVQSDLRLETFRDIESQPSRTEGLILIQLQLESKIISNEILQERGKKLNKLLSDYVAKRPGQYPRVSRVAVRIDIVTVAHEGSIPILPT